MKNVGSLIITTPSDREIAMSRMFDAPRQMVFDAYTKPELVKRWLGVQNGWTLDVCEIDLRVGGTFRYVWRGPNRAEMAMSSVCRELVIPERIVATEKFDDPWYQGEGIGTVEFIEQGGKTTLTMTVLYETNAIRDSVLASPMEKGVAASFEMLAELLAKSA